MRILRDPLQRAVALDLRCALVLAMQGAVVQGISPGRPSSHALYSPLPGTSALGRRVVLVLVDLVVALLPLAVRLFALLLLSLLRAHQVGIDSRSRPVLRADLRRARVDAQRVARRARLAAVALVRIFLRRAWLVLDMRQREVAPQCRAELGRLGALAAVDAGEECLESVAQLVVCVRRMSAQRGK